MAFDYGLFKPKETLLVIIDIQERLLPLIYNKGSLVKNTNILLKVAKTLDIPTLITEQYPKGLGHTDKGVESNGILVLEKVSFSVFGNEEISSFIKEINIKTLLICGIESHVCVLQSALHGLKMGFDVWVAEDALGSRVKANHNNAIKLMRQRGVNVSCVESLLFGALLDSKHRCFKSISVLIK